MNTKFTYTKICLWLFLFLALPIATPAQITGVGIASTSKMAKMSMAEGLAQKHVLLLDLVTKAGLMPLLSTNTTYTFFAPSDDALAKYQNASPEELKDFLGQHIVAGSHTTGDLKDGTDIKNINGNSLRIFRKKGAVLVDGVRLTETDQLFTNGVWHQLNGSLQASKPKL